MRQLSHNASICNRNVHTCAHFYYKMLHCGTWVWCIMGFNRPIVPSGIHCNKILFRLHTFSFKKVCLKMLTARYRPFWSILNLLIRISGRTGPWFNIKMSSCQYRKSHCGDKAVVRSSYLHNGIFYTGKMSLYWIDQSHRYGRPQAACREPAGSYDKTTRTAICFEHKTQYLLIRAPYTRIVVFWHISNTPMISQSQISCNTPMFYIAAIFVKYCYTTGSWLL